MTDSPELLLFTPAPVRARRDGWTVERQRVFIEALREHRSLTRAARAAGMSREGAYKLRRQPGAAGFAAAWDDALAADWRLLRLPADARYAKLTKIMRSRAASVLL